ncbi:MAG TPA: glycosyltransferase family 2 protein [Luteibaculaceae bacterium]|nr:glycosyltransferase family 2 protein [Luteibaculaceae bacterium]
MIPNGVSVVIPNFNGKGLLEQNLPTVAAALKTLSIPSEIIVSDDASTDDSLVFLADQYPGIHVLKSPRNSGFSANINRGIHQAQYDLCLLLNSDVWLSADFFQSLLTHFEDDRVFGVQANILHPETEITQDGAKVPALSLSGIKATSNALGNHPKLTTFFLSGAAALVRSDYLRQLGGFDEVYSPFYFEDVDLGIRAWRSGWVCLFDQQAKCYHPLSVTIKSHHKLGYIREITRRNKLILNHLHLDGWRRTVWMVNSRLHFAAAFLTGRKKKINAFLAYKLLLKNYTFKSYAFSLSAVIPRIKAGLEPHITRVF